MRADDKLADDLSDNTAPTVLSRAFLMSLNTLKSLFAYKRWANRELFALLAGVAPEQDVQPMLRTLSHIYATDRIFRAHLLGEAHGLCSATLPEIPSLLELRAMVEATDDWYLDYVTALSPEALPETVRFSFTDGDAGSMSREEMLLHITTHGAYHRGNVGQMLRERGVAPPRDLYTRYLHQAEPARRS